MSELSSLEFDVNLDGGRRTFKLLVFRDIPEQKLSALRTAYPDCEIRQTFDARELVHYRDWAEVVFGNVPAKWAVQAEKLKWLQIVSSGFDEYKALAGSKTVLTTAHGVHAPAIAEYVVFMMLLFAKNHLAYSKQQQDKVWDRRVTSPFLLSGRKLGLLGYGPVGREIVRRLVPFGLEITAVKRTIEGGAQEDLKLCAIDRLDHILAESDHLVVALPLTNETRGMLDREKVGLLKDGAYFYNVSRGGIVDEEALAVRLNHGTLAGAALDVFEREPLPQNSPLWNTRNLVITPHMAGHHRDLNEVNFDLFCKNLKKYAYGRPLKNVADFKRGY